MTEYNNQNDNSCLNEVARFNSGTLPKDLEKILPFFFIAVSDRHYLRSFPLQRSETDMGRFWITEALKGMNTPHPYRGVVVPIHTCRNPVMRGHLLEIPQLIQDSSELKLSEIRAQIQIKLDDAFGPGMELTGRAGRYGFYRLEFNLELFKHLYAFFDYLSEIKCAPCGGVQSIGTEPFAWADYSEFRKTYPMYRSESERFFLMLRFSWFVRV